MQLVKQINGVAWLSGSALARYKPELASLPLAAYYISLAFEKKMFVNQSQKISVCIADFYIILCTMVKTPAQLSGAAQGDVGCRVMRRQASLYETG